MRFGFRGFHRSPHLVHLNTFTGVPQRGHTPLKGAGALNHMPHGSHQTTRWPCFAISNLRVVQAFLPIYSFSEDREAEGRVRLYIGKAGTQTQLRRSWLYIGDGNTVRGYTQETETQFEAIYREAKNGIHAESHYPLWDENPARIAVIFFIFLMQNTIQ